MQCDLTLRTTVLGFQFVILDACFVIVNTRYFLSFLPHEYTVYDPKHQDLSWIIAT